MSTRVSRVQIEIYKQTGGAWRSVGRMPRSTRVGGDGGRAVAVGASAPRLESAERVCDALRGSAGIDGVDGDLGWRKSGTLPGFSKRGRGVPSNKEPGGTSIPQKGNAR